MRLTELAPKFLIRVSDREFRKTDSIAEADGVRFGCPLCYDDRSRPGYGHQIICWFSHAPLTTFPGPGRWSKSGTGYHDLTLGPKIGGSQSSVQVEGGCRWHGMIQDGDARNV